jgi:hypothetical protein
MKTGNAVGAVAILAGFGAAYYLGATRAPRGTTPPIRVQEEAGFVGFSPPEVNLGKQAWYAQVPFAATLVNRSRGAITVATVQTPCGCTTIDARRTSIASCLQGGILRSRVPWTLALRWGNDQKISV